MKLFILFSFLINVSVYSESFDQLQPLTDLDGRTLEAKLIEANSVTVKIEWNGQRFDLPIDTLDQDTRDLIERFKIQLSGSEKGVYNWMDVTGRSLRGKFIMLDDESLTLDLNGKISSLPLSMFDQESLKLAQKLSASDNKEIEKSDPIMELDLLNYFSWKNKEERVVKGRFLRMSKKELSIAIENSNQEVSIPLDLLSQESKLLAEDLNKLSIEQAKKSLALAIKRKAMELPELPESELEVEHVFFNTEGQSIRAVFLDADDEVVSLMISGRSDPVQLKWPSFSEDSAAKIEALRRKNVEVIAKKPRVVPAKGSKLSYFASGKFKGFNTILEQDDYVVAVPSTGTGVYIYIKQEVDEEQDSPLGKKRMTVGFRSRFVDRSDPKRARSKTRKILTFESSPSASIDRKDVFLKGTYDNGGSFEYNMELKKEGLNFWSKIRDPSGEKWQTRHYLGIGLPNVASSDVIDMEMAQIKAIVGDGAFYFSPMEGKRTRIPFDQSWKEIRKKNKINGNNLKLVEATGKPYMPLKINLYALNFRDMRLDFDKAYTKTYPLQGISLTYGLIEDRKQSEIPRSNALKITLSPNK